MIKCFWFTRHRECQFATTADRLRSCTRWLSFHACYTRTPNILCNVRRQIL